MHKYKLDNMEKGLLVFTVFFIALIGGTYLYALARLSIYTLNNSSEPLVWILMIGGGATLLSLVLALVMYLFQPVFYVLGLIFAALGALFGGIINAVRRARA